MAKYLLNLIIILFVLPLWGQVESNLNNANKKNETLFRNEVDKSYTFRYTTGNVGDKTHTNNMVSAISQAKNLSNSTGFSWGYSYKELLVIDRKQGNLIIKASISTKKITGRAFVDGISIAERLYPDRMNFKIQLSDGKGKPIYEQAFYQVDVNRLNIKNSYVEVASITVADTFSNKNLTIQLIVMSGNNSKLLFYHTAAVSSSLVQQLDLINLYNQDAGWLAKVIKDIKNFDLNNLEMVFQYKADLEEMKKGVDQIIEADYKTKLHLQKNDPKDLLDKLAEFSGLYRSTDRELSNIMKTLDDAYYNRGLSFIKIGDLNKARLFFNKALDINSNHCPSHYQLGLMDFEEGKYIDSRLRINNMIDNMNPPPDIKRLAEDLLLDIQEMMAKEKYEEYLALLERAEDEWRLGNLETAIYYINKATDFQFENGIYITSNEDAQKLFDHIITDLTADAERDVSAGRLQMAINKYQDIISFCETSAQKLTDFVALERRLIEIRELYLSRIISQGAHLVAKGDFAKAEEKIDESLAYLNMHTGLSNKIQLDLLIENFTEELLLTGKQELNYKHFTASIELFNHLLRIQDKYGYHTHSDIFRYLNEAWGGILAQILYSGQQSMNNGDYIIAEQKLREAISLTIDHPGIMNIMAVEAYKENLLASHLSEGKKLLKNGDYYNSLTWFSVGQRLVYEYGISTSVSISSLIFEAHSGICNTMIDRSLSFLSSEKFNDAMVELGRAYDYMVSNNLTGTPLNSNFNEAAESFYNEIARRIDNLNKGKQFEEAIVFIYKLRDLCQTYYHKCDPGQIDMREKASRYGLYLEMITGSYEAIHTGDLSLAKKLASDALAYQLSYSKYIQTAVEAETAMNRIKIAEYRNFIHQGKVLLDKNDFLSSLSLFDQAKSLEISEGFLVDNDLIKYRKRAAKGVVLGLCDELLAGIENNQLMVSKDKLLRIIQMSAKYNILGDIDISDKISQLDEKLLSKACRIQCDKYNGFLDSAYQLAKDRDFIGASVYIDRAISIVKKQAECRLSDSTATRYRQQLSPAIQYQEMQQEAKENIAVYKNAEGLSAYIKSEQHFYKYDVHLFGLKHITFFEFAQKQHNSFVFHTAYYYINLEDQEKSYRMLEELQQRGYPRKQTRNIQQKLGQMLAERDIKQFPDKKWKDVVKEYTRGNKFYKYLRKAFKKRWKELD